MIVASSVIILIYTFLGGMYSVAFTDVFQLFCIVAGMVSKWFMAIIRYTISDFNKIDWFSRPFACRSYGIIRLSIKETFFPLTGSGR